MGRLRDFAAWLFALPDASSPNASADPFVDLDQLLVQNDRRLVSALLVFLLVPLFWSFGLEMATYANDWTRLEARLMLRAASVLIPIVGLMAVRSAQTRMAYSRAVLFISLAFALNLVNALLRPRGSALPLRLPMMILIMMYGALPNSFLRQIVPPLIYTAGVIVERVFWVTSSVSGDLPSDVLILVFVNAIGIVMVYRRVTLEEEMGVRFRAEQRSVLAARQALADLRSLRAIIPICSHCRKVRTEGGDWLQLESYVAEHTDADFSHGVCPSCVQEHYPRRKRNP